MTGATEELHRTHITDLRLALEIGDPQIPADLRDECQRMLGAIEERLELGVDYTIVALAGGTGSGKSSTFNALSGLEFADVGVKRPTTARVNACSWSADATRLLDWLGVDPDRRITRDTILDTYEEQELAGLILLDLPDHDSVVEQHKDVVDAILPLVDLLIWIVDPQKYADQALHAGYLRKLVDAQASMVVAVNQIDKVADFARDLLIVDIEQMLIADGLDQVVVRAVSARTGEGIEELRSELKGAVARQSMASARMRDELARLGHVILEEVPSTVVTDPEQLLDAEVDKILVASGVNAVSDQVLGLQTSQEWQAKPPVLETTGLSQISALREQWVRKVSAGMSDPWARLLTVGIPEAAQITAELTHELAQVEVPWHRYGPVSQSKKFAVGALGVVAIFVALIVLEVTSVMSTSLVLLWIGGVAVAGGAAVWFWYRSRKAATQWGQEHAERVRKDAHSAVRTVLERTYIEPIAPVLDRHDRVRRLAHRVIHSQ